MDTPQRTGKKTICLTMIVKDESHVIVETLQNIWSYIPFDTYAISDTGSSDNTKALIKAFFDEKGVTGVLVDDPWVDFGHNRTIAFRHAAATKADYAFVWDADDRIHGNFKLPSTLDADQFHFIFRNGDTTYVRCQLFNNHKRWKYVGVLHEYPACEETVAGTPVCVIGNYHFSSNRTGARNKDPQKYLKDGVLLEKAFHKAVEDKDPIQNRYAYYCAQSYRNASLPEKALEFYKQVLALKDAWAQEKYNACIELFTILDEQKKPQEGIPYLIESYSYDKTRVEGVFRLVQYYCIRGQPEVARAFYGLVQAWYETQYDPDTISSRLFAKRAEYDFYLPYYMIIVADRIKDRALGVRMYERIFRFGHVASEWWARNLIHNLQFFLDALPSENLAFCHSMMNYVDRLSLEAKHHEIMERALAKFHDVLGSPWEDLKPPATCGQGNRVLLTFTTCKRWGLFQQTVRSILRSWTDVSQVSSWFCVDDNSSEEDRIAMRATFPWIEYHMKGATEKGHRESMNIIWNRLQKTKPTFWIHLEDDWLFFKREAYVTRGIAALDTYRGRDVQQIVFNRNYGVVYSDMDRVGGKVLEPGLLLHEKKEGIVGKNCGYWPHYSLQPSICRVEAILSLGNYDSPNRFFERDYANRYFERGYQTAFFNGMYSTHIGKQHWEAEGQNAYALNEMGQFNGQQNQGGKTSIVESKGSEPEPEAEPEPEPTLSHTYQPLKGTMADHLDQILALIQNGTPFGLIRPSDGEYRIIRGETLTNCDKWTFTSGGTLQKQLLEAVQTQDAGLYIGIPCNTCNKPWNCYPAIHNDYMDLIPVDQRTYANLFMNSNWSTLVQFLKDYKRGLCIVSSGKAETMSNDIRVKACHTIDEFLVNRWDTEGASETARLLEFVKGKRKELICFSAGPLSKVWIPLCRKANPHNMYVDMGAAIDLFTKGTTTRLYTDRGHEFAKEACAFREKRHLAYMCVFYNKDYIKLLALLLTSIKLYSSLKDTDILVITSKEFEPLIQDLSKTLQLPIRTTTLDVTTIFQAACARLTVFDYQDVHQYDTLLYLDTDILVKGDITTLFTFTLEDKLYGLESGMTSMYNFGTQFFDSSHPPVSGINSGTLLFRNTPTLRDLFTRIRSHIQQYTKQKKHIPYALDQPFINYHAIKDSLYENKTLIPYVSLFEDNDTPTNLDTSIVCHFSFPIGNFGHKYSRMRRYFKGLLSNYTDVTKCAIDIVGRTYSWDNRGMIQFINETDIVTTWGKGQYDVMDSDTLCVYWNNHYHMIKLMPDDTFMCIRTSPDDFETIFGKRIGHVV